jgi:ribosomal-protein-alanine N-acetyltransferase
MASSCRIRAATSADLAAVAQIERASFADPWSLAAFRARLDDIFLVAEAASGITGYAVAWCLGPEAEILNVAVAPSGRRQGTGRILLRTLLAAIVQAGVRRVFLEVRVSNAAACALYGNAGFREVGRRPGYYDHPREDALILARDVSAADAPA